MLAQAPSHLQAQAQPQPQGMGPLPVQWAPVVAATAPTLGPALAELVTAWVRLALGAGVPWVDCSSSCSSRMEAVAWEVWAALPPLQLLLVPRVVLRPCFCGPLLRPGWPSRGPCGCSSPQARWESSG